MSSEFHSMFVLPLRLAARSQATAQNSQHSHGFKPCDELATCPGCGPAPLLLGLLVSSTKLAG